MTKGDKYLDDLFREKLGGFEEVPPAHVWANIQQTQGVAAKKRLLFFLKLTGVAAAILMTILIGRQVIMTPESDLTQGQVVEIQKPIDAKVQQEAERTIPPENQVAASEMLKTENPVKQEESSRIEDQKSSLTLFAQANINENEIAVPKNNQQNNDVSESFPLLESIQRSLFPFSSIQENLKKIPKHKKPQVLTVDDLAMIERNKQLLVQNADEEIETQWQVGAMVAPNLAVNQSNHNSSYASNMSVPGSKENINVGGGLSVSYKASKRWSIQSGVYYSQLDQNSSNEVNRVALSPGRDNLSFDGGGAEYFNTAVEVKSNSMLLNATAGVVEIDNLPSNARIGNGLESAKTNEGIFLTAAEFQQNFEYVEIPLNVRYQLVDSKIDVNLLGGVSSNFLIGNNAYLQNDFGRERIGETKDMNAVNYSTTIGFGIGYEISNKLSFNIEPQIKYFLGSLNNNSQLSFKPYTIGIYTGLNYRF